MNSKIQDQWKFEVDGIEYVHPRLTNPEIGRWMDLYDQGINRSLHYSAQEMFTIKDEKEGIDYNIAYEVRFSEGDVCEVGYLRGFGIHSKNPKGFCCCTEGE